MTTALVAGAARPRDAADEDLDHAGHAEQAGVVDQTDWWRVDARTFAAGGRSYDLVTTHFLHPPDGGMVEVTRRLAEAVSPGGHLLVVGHAPSEAFTHLTASHRRATFRADELLPGLPGDFEALVVEQRPRTVPRNELTVDVHDSTLLARRQATPTTPARSGRSR